MYPFITIVSFTNKYLLIWVYILLFFVLTKANAQSIHSLEVGAPFSYLYTPDQYKNHNENFAIAQDKRGVMYFGNFGGLLEYDGINWRMIRTTLQTKISSLYYSNDSILYVGARDEFGYLYTDSTGSITFKSLNTSIVDLSGEISKIIEIDKQIYFISTNKIYKLINKKITALTVSKPIQSIFNYKNKLLVYYKDLSIEIKNPTTLKTESTLNIGLKNIINILPVNSKNSLIFTQRNGIYTLSNNTVTEFKSEASGLFLTTPITNVILFSKDTIAVWSNEIGLSLINKAGNVLKKGNKKEKINYGNCNAIFKDKDSNLWLALDNGIAQLVINSPLSIFSNSIYDLGAINSVVRHSNKLFLGTTKGLYYLNDRTFIPVSGITAGCWSLLTVKQGLLIASSNGTYLLPSLTASVQRINKEYSFSLTQDKANADHVFVGNREGLARISQGKSTTYQQIQNYGDNIINVFSDNYGDVWLESISKGIFRYTPSTNTSVNYRYTTPSGELTRVGNRIINSDNGVILYNTKGVFKYNKPVDSFSSSSFLNTETKNSSVGNKNWFGLLVKDPTNNYWATEGDDKKLAFYQNNGGIFKKDTTQFLPISDIAIRTIYPDKDNITWFGTPKGLIRFDDRFSHKNAIPFQAYIRRISNGDSTVFNGYSKAGSAVDKTLDPLGNVKFNSQTNALKFEFSAATYASSDKLLFQYYLDGFDKTWSLWSDQTAKEYTNLAPGSYVFHVKAKNAYGVESTESTFSFTIGTPVYRRWWAIVLYVVLGGTALAALFRMRLSKLERERIQLENLIKERTEEIVDQKQELERQSEELVIQNDQLEKIDLIVQSINAEVDFSNLFQTILAKFSVIRNMDNGTFLVYDKASDTFRFKALRGIQDLSAFESLELTLDQAKDRYLSYAEEVYEDIYYKNDVRFSPLNNLIDNLNTPKSLLTIVIKNEGKIEAFILLENISRAYAFDQRDINMIRNLKEHLIAAFIKTKLLEDLENTLSDLKNTQDELIRQEKLASVGQLTKGIVDRILNPLNYVNNFSQLSEGLIEDLVDSLKKQRENVPADSLDDMLDEVDVLKTNLVKIQEHSNSTTRILKDMQRLLKEKSRDFLETDLNNFIDNKARSSVQEIKTHYKDFSVNLKLNLENKPIKVSLLPYEFGQVIQNIVSNAYYALHEKSKSDKSFTPEINITTKAVQDQVFIRFRDNGKGIPQREIEKLFSPFFTTKPTSEGTGLGLFMVKDIIELHKGKIEINSQEGAFTEILVMLPSLSAAF